MDAADALDRSLTRKIAAERRGLQAHLAAYVFVVALLWAIDLTTGGPTWAFWPTMGWGFGLLSHFGGMRAKVDRLEAKRDAALHDLAPASASGQERPAPPLLDRLDDAPDVSGPDATLARAEALLARERG